MLSRYRIVRGRRPPDDPLPDGVRVDIRKHTRHFLHPEPAMVESYLQAPEDPKRWAAFERAYLELLRGRFADDPEPFRVLADRARTTDVHLGCSCPTQRQPDVYRCHTVLALRFMAECFADLEVVMP